MSGCALFLLAPVAGHAGDITIPSGTTVTTTQTLTDVGDTGTIDSSGAIDVTDEDGLVLDNDDQTAVNNGDIFVERTGGASLAGIGSLGANSDITNNGTITGTGEGIFAIVTTQEDAVVVNSGTIDLDGDFNTGIELDGDDSSAENSGSIFTNGLLSDGMSVFGDNGSVTNSGTIETTGENAFGIYSNGAASTLINNDTITTTGDVSFGIGANGDDAVVSNSGSISTTGEDADGINIAGEDSSATNSGTITTTGEDTHGIGSAGDDSEVTNTGTITTEGDRSNAINTDGNRTVVTNTGTVVTTGEGSDGIDNDGNDVTVINSGTLTQFGSQGNGIDVHGANGDITNSGTITVSGEDSNGIEVTGNNVIVRSSGSVETTGPISGSDPAAGHGISVEGNNATVTVSGTVFSTNGSSIYVDGSDAIVTIDGNALLQGIVTLTEPSSADFTYNRNRTAILTFSGLPGTLETGGLAYRTSGNTLTIFNPDDYRLDTLAPVFTALTREISDGVERQMAPDRLEAPALVATHGTPAETVASRWSLWASPYGGGLHRWKDNGFDHVFGGLMAGADTSLAPGLKAGVAAGFSAGHTNSDDDIHSADSYSFFAGGYLNQNWQATFMQASLIGGYLKSDETVTILNNMVSGGLQDLSIDYDYVFVNPSVRLGHEFALQTATLTPSIRARYSGLWQTGDAEETTTSFSVSGRSLHILEVRAQTAYDFAPVPRESGTFHVGLKAGLDGIFTLGDSVDGSFAGTALNLSTGNGDAIVRGFAKADAVWQKENGTMFLAGVESGYDSAGTLSATGRLGAKIRF